MINVAILGCGAIAQKMATTIVGVDETCAYAVAARNFDRAETFRQEYGFQKAYGSYTEMLADLEVQLVYVAVPHSHHYQCVKLCLDAGKHVLCEKAFTVNADQAKKLIDLSREKGLLLAEAIWTRYMPSRTIIKDLLDSGVIGQPISTIADLCYNIAQKKRIQDKNLAGGALLDLGVYMLNYARMVFESPVIDIISDVQHDEEGVDYVDSLSLTFESGQTALLHSNALVISGRRADILGTEGYITITNTNNPEKIEVFDANYNCVQTIIPPEQITGFEYELRSCVRAIEGGEVECPEMPHSEILYIMQLMDSLRARWGYSIPEIE